MFFLNGIINIEFNNVQDLNYVQENWNSFDDFPNSSVISLNQLKNKNNFCNIIIRDVPLNLTDAEILNDLKLNCEKLQSVQRFIKKGKPLPIVKLTFKDESNINEIINSGIYINNMFFQPEIFTEVRKPLTVGELVIILDHVKRILFVKIVEMRIIVQMLVLIPLNV